MSLNCPYCGKPLQLVKAAPPPPPDTSLDDDLAAYAHLLYVATGDGVVLYALKEYQEDKTIWRSINHFVQKHGGKWISAGRESHWEVPV